MFAVKAVEDSCYFFKFSVRRVREDDWEIT